MINKEDKETQEVILDRFKGMSAEKKLNLSLQLYNSARKLKTAALRQLYPELTEKEIEAKVKESFFMQELSIYQL